MRRALNDYILFLKEFRRTFHTTGALLPSSPLLGRALARYVAGPADRTPTAPRRILEVGPGTGAVTRHIARRLNAGDHLDLVELNERFAERLRHLFQHDPQLRRVSHQVNILHAAVQTLDRLEPYDVIVSGLPFNNFAAADVESFLDTFQRLARPGGILSFFEYIAVRPARGVIAGRAEKQRLRRIGQVLSQFFVKHEIRREAVWINVPPAWVHHLRFTELAEKSQPLEFDARRTAQQAADQAKRA